MFFVLLKKVMLDIDFIDINCREVILNRNLSHLRLIDLQLLISAYKFNSLTKAAKHHHLSQSAASSAIQRVESAFGQTISTHEKRQFTLSPTGQSIVTRAEKWLLQFDTDVIKAKPAPIRIVTTHAMARMIISANILEYPIELKLMRPDKSYLALQQDKADLAIVPGNAAWKDVNASEISSGFFQLYSSKNILSPEPILLPEDQIEVLELKRKWQNQYKCPIPTIACIPSWSLIADICCNSEKVGFLPDFLSLNTNLKPVNWQPAPSKYKILALYRKQKTPISDEIQTIITQLRHEFN